MVGGDGRGRGWLGAVTPAVALGFFGCALPQPEACRLYVACQAAVDPAVDTSDEAEGGRCWALPDTARQCEAMCQEALDALRATPSPPPACRQDAATTAP